MSSILIRAAVSEDATALLHFTKYVYENLGAYTAFSQEEFIEDHAHWIKFIERFNRLGSLLLIALDTNTQKIVGVCDFSANQLNKVAHWGKFGISIHEDYQNKGLGTQLIQQLITWAKQHHQLEMIGLSVHANNLRAIHVYKKLGFVEKGRIPNCIKEQDGTYIDSLELFLML